MNPSGVARNALPVLTVCAAYYIGGLVGLALRINPVDMSVIWPPSAILLAVLMLTPVGSWWVYLLPLFPIHLYLLTMVRTDAPAAVMICHFAGAVGQTVLAALGVRKFVGVPPRLNDVRRMSAFMLFAAILAPAITGAAVAGAYVFLGWNDEFWPSWQSRFLTNVFPTLTITPLIVALASGKEADLRNFSLSRSLEYALVSGALVGLALLVFAWDYEVTTQHALTVAPVVLLLCTAVRFGPTGLNVHLLIVAVAALSAAKFGKGPFGAITGNESALAVQVYLLVIALPMIMLTVLVQERNRTDRALRESSKRFQMATAAGGIGVWDWNLQTKELFIDPVMKGILGFRDEEIQNHMEDWLHHVHEDDKGWVQDRMRQHLDGDSPLYEAEYRVMHRDGSVRWFFARGAAVERNRGNPVRLIGTEMDITERKRAEQALLQNEARYRAVVEDQTELICRFLPDGTYTFVNDAYCRYFQSSAEELIGRSFWMFIPPDKHKFARKLLDSATPEHPVISCEHQVIAPGGELRWQQWRDRGLFDANGHVVEFQAVGRDITERKNAEEEHRQLEAQKQVEIMLRESESRFRQLADSMPQIVWTATPDGTIDYFNRQWYEITGIPRGTTGADGWLPVVHIEDRQHCIDRWIEAVHNGHQYECEARFRCGKEGSHRWHLLRALPSQDRTGHILRWYGTCTDIDDQKRAERALLDADKRKDEFLAMLAHELRNPLAPIGTAVEILRRVPVPKDAQWARDVIGRQATHLTRLVDDLLDVSRITRGKIRLNTALVELDGVIAQAVETSRPLIESRRQVLSLEIRNGSLQLIGDAMRLAQIVSNLLNNASKYTDVDGRIHLTVARVEADITISVKDSGIGIPRTMLARIFELFAQIETTKDRSQGGLGIGLTLVRSLVQMHGGSVEARSDGPGMGSEFVIRLPAPVVEKQMPAADVPLAKKSPPAHLRIVIVEDNQDLAKTLAFLLSAHQVRVAHDGASALEVIRVFEPDVVVLDIGLPKMDGFQVARRLRQEPRTRPLRLIAMSGYGQDDDRRQSTEAGFDHHLVKPIDPNELELLLVGSCADTGSVFREPGPTQE